MMSLRTCLVIGLCSLLLVSFVSPKLSDEISYYKNEWSNDASFVDPRDSTSYNTVTIGNQIWMSENLRWLPRVSPPDEGSQVAAYYYVYDYEGTSVEAAKSLDSYKKFGTLYNWRAASIACPEGWRLPSDSDWEELINFLIDNYTKVNDENIGNSLKSKKHWSTISGIDYLTAKGRRRFIFKGTNDFGFNALPGGFRSFYNSNFSKIGLYGLWWSSSEKSLTKSSYWVLSHHSGWIRNDYMFDIHRRAYYSSESEHYKASGYSVRCIRVE